MQRYASLVFTLVLALACFGGATAQEKAVDVTLFTNVNVFDGVNEKLIRNANVVVTGNLITRVSTEPLAVAGAKVIDGGGRTLMPGLSDCHWHAVSIAMNNVQLLTEDPNYITLLVAAQTERTLMQGITTVRDVGGNVFAVKRWIDEGRLPGPRILPSGAYLTPTSGHGEMRLPHTLPREQGRALIDLEIAGQTKIADGVPAVLQRTRENFMSGATQIKAMAGGGVASFSDPMDGAQFTLDELRAMVEEANNWNSYVTVHAYTSKAVQHALRAGVRSIEHGQMMDKETAKMIKDADAWVCMQPFQDDEDRIPLQGEFNNYKYNLLLAGVDKAYDLAKQYGLKVGFGTDLQQNPDLIDRWGAQLVKLKKWYTPAQALRMATSVNQEYFRMSGPRHPYREGPLGVVKAGAYADLLLVDGDPLANIDLIADPDKNFVVIMKDGKIYKNAL